MEPWHLLLVAMNCRKEDRDSGIFDGDTDQRWACRQALKLGVGFTVIDATGNPIACFGFAEESRFTATMWLIASRTLNGFVREIRRTFDKFVAQTDYIRIQATADPDRPGAVRFIEFGGFKFECALPGIGARGQLLNLYSIVR